MKTSFASRTLKIAAMALFFIPHTLFAQEVPKEDREKLIKAFQECLKGRCADLDARKPGEMPPYDLGLEGYPLDNERTKAFRKCLREKCKDEKDPAKNVACWKDKANQDACQKVADTRGDECRKDPCGCIYDGCIASRPRWEAKPPRPDVPKVPNDKDHEKEWKEYNDAYRKYYAWLVATNNKDFGIFEEPEMKGAPKVWVPGYWLFTPNQNAPESCKEHLVLGGMLEKDKKNCGEHGTYTFVREAPTEEVWKRECEDRKNRCVKITGGMPIDGGITRQLDGTCKVGHNCHHAATSMCECLAKKGITEIHIVLMSGPDYLFPVPRGNSGHSMLTVPSPFKVGERCLVESQENYSKSLADGKDLTKVVEAACCYAATDLKSEAEAVKKLERSSCTIAKIGPNYIPKSYTYDIIPFEKCDEFLKKMGTGETDVK